jgi:2-hydroxy-3-keto-5-methylthiopentenyl-1-phosphate phosphatase
MSAAAHADLLFVKLTADGGQSDLAKYCIREKIKHVEFQDL